MTALNYPTSTSHPAPSAPKVFSDRAEAEREAQAVARERAAARRGFMAENPEALVTGKERPYFSDPSRIKACLAEAYPWPRLKTTEPRTLVDEKPVAGMKQEWRVVDGAVQYRPAPGQLSFGHDFIPLEGRSMWLTRERALMIADLLAKPTRTIDVEVTA